MSELSAETQAIIQRLKDEGELVRNRGTNSIRSVKIQLDRFENVFNTISTNIIEQTSILRRQTGFAQEALEQQRTREQLEELEIEKEKYDDGESGRQDTDEKIDKIGDSIAAALSFKNIALAAGGLFLGYNILKGFIDERTGGGFSSMEDAIADTNWSGLASNFNSLSVAFSGLGERLLEFNSFLDNLPAFLVGGGMAGYGLRSLGAGLVSGGMGGPGPRAGILSRIAPGILMATTGLAIFYGEEIENYLTEQMGADPDVANHVVTTAQATLGAMTLLRMFGATPQGLLLTAAVGTAVALGFVVKNWIDGEKDKQLDEFNKQIDAAQLAAETALSENRDLSNSERTDVATALYESRRRMQLALSDTAITEAEAAANEMEKILGEQTLNTGQGLNQAQMERVFSDVLSGDVGARAELMAAFSQEEQNRGTISRFFTPDSQEYLRNRLIDFGEGQMRSNESLLLDSDAAARAEDAWYSIVDQIMLGQNSTRGRGTMVERPGERAAYTREQEAIHLDALLEATRLHNESVQRTQDEMDLLQKYINSIEEGNAGGGAVIINAPTNVSPVINNVSGGKSVNQVSIRGGGGGGGGLFGLSNPYGLPFIVN